MVEQSDRAPLLDWEEIPPQPEPARTSPSELVAPPQESVPRPDRRTAEGPGRIAAAPKGLNGAASPARLPERCGPGLDHVPNPSVLPEHTLPCSSARQRWEDGDQVVAVFVVTFDTRSGNMVEWCMPQDVNLDGVEFKSMASGSHRVSSDFIYFRKGSYFGLACFANVHVESARERGARMKSVGVLCPCYTLLYRYMHFLENQVRLQLQSPGHYSPLEAFYQDKKALLAPSAWGPPAWGPASVNRCMQPDMKITHPAGCMSQFSLFFGEQIMVLWKLALLRKRLLFFSPPPVGVVCYRVYCCCCLANVSIPGMGGAAPELRPFFYVNIADIAALETELSYVACTTEKIFEEKKDLYDVYIDNQNVRTHRASLQPLLRLNAADRDKYRKLSEQRQMLLYSQEVNGDVTSNEEELFILFFMQLNDRIFQTLAEVSGGGEPMLTQDQVQAMGLDPQGDRRFLEQLLEVYGIDATLVSDHPCCT